MIKDPEECWICHEFKPPKYHTHLDRNLKAICEDCSPLINGSVNEMLIPIIAAMYYQYEQDESCNYTIVNTLICNATDILEKILQTEQEILRIGQEYTEKHFYAQPVEDLISEIQGELFQTIESGENSIEYLKRVDLIIEYDEPAKKEDEYFINVRVRDTTEFECIGWHKNKGYFFWWKLGTPVPSPLQTEVMYYKKISDIIEELKKRLDLARA